MIDHLHIAAINILCFIKYNILFKINRIILYK